MGSFSAAMPPKIRRVTLQFLYQDYVRILDHETLYTALQSCNGLSEVDLQFRCCIHQHERQSLAWPCSIPPSRKMQAFLPLMEIVRRLPSIENVKLSWTMFQPQHTRGAGSEGPEEEAARIWMPALVRWLNDKDAELPDYNWIVANFEEEQVVHLGMEED